MKEILLNIGIPAFILMSVVFDLGHDLLNAVHCLTWAILGQLLLMEFRNKKK